MKLDEYLRLQDDGCPNCGEHVYRREPRWTHAVVSMTITHERGVPWEHETVESMTEVRLRPRRNRRETAPSPPPEFKPLGLRVSLAGFLGNAADEMRRLAAELRERDGYDAAREDEPGAVRDPALEADWMVGMLREVSRHAAQVAGGAASLREFARHYSLEGDLPIPDNRVQCERPEPESEVRDGRTDAGSTGIPADD